VFALDASVIDLTLSLYPWAKFRATKGAIKLHTMIELRGNIPAFLTITDGKVHDVVVAPQVPIEPDGIYVVDRGYVDFSWLGDIDRQKAFFVTRLKTSIRWTRVISRSVDKSLGVRADQKILLASKRLKAIYPRRLRRVSFHDEIQDRKLVFITNNFDLPAATIAALYKSRWEIELFFKWIKQNLRVKTFYGTSPNAVKTQIWIAMIVYLVLALLKQRYRLEPSLSQLLHFLESNLFEPKPLAGVFQMNTRCEISRPPIQLNLF
jgi:transposase